MNLIAKDYDKLTGITTEYLSVEGGKKVTVRRWQDADPILDNNAAMLNAQSSKGRLNTREGLGVKVASIPMGFIEQYLAETGINLMTCSHAELHKVLNNSDYKKLRTAHGRV